MKFLTRFIFCVSMSIFLISCGSKVDGQYDDLMEYIEKTDYVVTSAGHQSGYVQGTSAWKWIEDNNAIRVKYSALDQTATEIGDVKNLTLDKTSCGFADCSGYFNTSFSGTWDCRTSGDGKLNIAFSSVEPEIVVYIFGEGNWQHSRYMKLKTTFEEYRKKLVELGILTEQDIKNSKNKSAASTEGSTIDSTGLNDQNEGIDTTDAINSSSQEIEKTYFVINDPDGFTNLRDAPNGNIVKKVQKGEKFEIIEKGSSHSKVLLQDGTEGFIHNSRIQPAN